MNFVGAVRILENVRCIKCRKGNKCDMSVIKMMMGPAVTAQSVGVNSLEKQIESIKTAEEFGRDISKVLNKS